MLFRRLVERLKSGNWHAIWIEFLIVVFGVFFGFQVTNWNEARRDRTLERGYLARISADMVRSREQTQNSNDAMRRQAEGATLVLRALDSCRLPDGERDAFARALFTLGKFDTATLDETTIDELKSTGRSTVLRRVELREALSALSRSVELQHRIEPQFRDRISPFVNYIQFLVQFDIDSVEATNSRTLTWRRMRINMPEVCADRRFRASVSNVRDMTYEVIKQNEDVLAQINALIVLLED